MTRDYTLTSTDLCAQHLREQLKYKMAFSNSKTSLFFLLSLSQSLTHSLTHVKSNAHKFVYSIIVTWAHSFFSVRMAALQVMLTDLLFSLFNTQEFVVIFILSYFSNYEFQNGTAYRIITMSKICTKCETQQTFNFNFNFNIKFKDTHTHINTQWMCKKGENEPNLLYKIESWFGWRWCVQTCA